VLAAAFAVFVAPSGGATPPAAPQQLPPARIHAPKGYAPPQKTRESEAGRALYERLECALCHSIAGKGGTAGPPLDGVGVRRGADVIVGQLADPQHLAEQHPEQHRWEPSYMPHPKLTRTEIRRLTAYLMTLPEPPGGFAVEGHAAEAAEPPAAPTYFPAPRTEASERGEHLFFTAGCAECHAIGRLGGEFGPRLDGIGGRRTRPFVAAHITNPRLHTLEHPGDFDGATLMPQPALPPDQIDAIVDFLLTIPDLGDPNAP
jgi:mono/diheme cytochrome c family protein